MQSVTRGVAREEGERSGGKNKWKLSEINTRAVSRGQNKLTDKFEMAAGAVISVRGQVMEHTYIPTGIKGIWRDLVWIATGRGPPPTIPTTYSSCYKVPYKGSPWTAFLGPCCKEIPF